MAQATLNQPDPFNILEEVQGDVLIGFPKNKEVFFFFKIEDVAGIKDALKRLNIASTADVVAIRDQVDKARGKTPRETVHVELLNIAFSKRGLDALQVKGDIGDKPFNEGQLAGAKALGDDGRQEPDKPFDPDWEAAFKATHIDGVLLVAGDSLTSVNKMVDHAMNVLGQSIRVVYTLRGSVRPKDQRGHEHFGWDDGISNPAVKGVGYDGHDNILPGQRQVPPGIILRGLKGDRFSPPDLPAWAKGGSFLVFRQLEQLVPEFHEYLKLEAHRLGLDPVKGADLLGARLFGRWKSGAPIQLTENLEDDPILGNDKNRNNHFKYPKEGGDVGQDLCPYAAHIRKVNPRNDFIDWKVERTSIIRAGIPYGTELTDDEKNEKVTEHPRGLAFVCYQSSIDNGFRLMQEQWSNDPKFVPKKLDDEGKILVGLDPIIGQANGVSRDTWGTEAGLKVKGMPEFIISRGGEYFFSPPISALRNGFEVVPSPPS